MSEWNRFTREVTLEQVPEAMKAEIHRPVELYTLGEFLSNPLMCILSDAEKKKSGLFGSKRMLWEKSSRKR